MLVTYSEYAVVLNLPLDTAMVVGSLAISRKDASLSCLSPMGRVHLCFFSLWFKKKAAQGEAGEMLDQCVDQNFQLMCYVTIKLQG